MEHGGLASKLTNLELGYMSIIMQPEYDWIDFFEAANKRLMSENSELLSDNLSERTVCGCLSQILYDELKRTHYSDYFVDVEYNRNNGKLKTIIDGSLKVVTINCDLIIHSRRRNLLKDNLIALEMKKSERAENDKIKDRERLTALTKKSYDNIYSVDGINLPEHVCGYSLGIYYEIKLRDNIILIEYYKDGKLHGVKELAIKRDIDREVGF